VLWVSGQTESDDFPVSDALDRCDNGGGDLFLARFDSEGVMLSSTYIGGASTEGAPHAALLPGGGLALAAATQSMDFPGSTRNNAGARDAVSLSVDPGMLSLRSAYFGGAGDESVESIATDGWGLVWMTGGTNSSTLPLVAPSVGLRDAWVARMDPVTGAPLWAARLGSAADDEATALAVDPRGNLFLAGDTRSNLWRHVPPQASRPAGGQDVFLAGLRESWAEDLFLLALAWQLPRYYGPLDLDWNGVANTDDLFQLQRDWNP